VIVETGAVIETVTAKAGNRSGNRQSDKVSLKKMTLTGDGHLVVGKKQIASFPGREGQPVKVDLDNGVIRKVVFDDGTEQEFVLVYDPLRQECIDSFVQPAAMPQYRNAVLKNAVVGDDGILRLGGREYEGLEE
jgi:hypothetical protein